MHLFRLFSGTSGLRSVFPLLWFWYFRSLWVLLFLWRIANQFTLLYLANWLLSSDMMLFFLSCRQFNWHRVFPTFELWLLFLWHHIAWLVQLVYVFITSLLLQHDSPIRVETDIVENLPASETVPLGIFTTHKLGHACILCPERGCGCLGHCIKLVSYFRYRCVHCSQGDERRALVCRAIEAWLVVIKHLWVVTDLNGHERSCLLLFR